VRQAVTLLGEWGGCCESEVQDGGVVLRCSDCPLALVAAGHPEVCRIMETALADLLAVPVRQHCRMDLTPQCRFAIGTPAV
jgi:hypothetical protein